MHVCHLILYLTDKLENLKLHSMSKMSPLVILLLAVVLKQGASIQYAPVIRIKSGPIRGIVSQLNTGGAIRKYLGIPFAKAERFGEPTDPDPWTDLKDATTNGKMCPQEELYGRKFDDMSEDCLNLNVFVPEGAGSSLPVMVWIHGGAFRVGTNYEDGNYLASLGVVIVVTINYRLNIFGFLATSKDGDLTGNYGLLDQVKALTWVQNNIGKFGGNRNKVTIFGVSAGGASVCHLVLSPMAEGLFQNAIPQAGDATAEWSYNTYSVALQIAKMVGKALGCESIDSLADCLKTKSCKELLRGTDVIRKTTLSFAPVVGGSLLPADTPEALLSSRNISVNILIGFNNNEGTAPTNAVQGVAMIFNVTDGFERSLFESLPRKGYLNWIVRGQNKVINEAILYRYTDWDNVTDRYSNRREFLDMLGDAIFIAPAIKTARALARKSVKTYMYQLQYRFNYTAELYPVPSWVGAHHGADRPVVFGQPFSLAAASNASVYTKDANFSRAVIRMWTNFAKTGDPNKPADIGLVWPQYDLKQQQFMALKSNMAVQSKLRNDYVAFWNSFVSAALKSMPKPSQHPVNSSAILIVSGLTAIQTALYAGMLQWYF